MNLYELTQNFETVLNMLYTDTDEQAVFDTLECIECEIEEKADNYAKMIKNIEGDINNIKTEIERLTNKKQSLETKIKWLKTNLENAMLKTGKTKFKTALFSFNIQKNAPSLLIETEDNIPKKYYIEQEPKLDRKTLLSALKEGEQISGVSIQQTESLRIR